MSDISKKDLTKRLNRAIKGIRALRKEHYNCPFGYDHASRCTCGAAEIDEEINSAVEVLKSEFSELTLHW